MVLSANPSGTNTYLQFLTVLLLFVFVLFITWFTTRWIAKLQRGQMSTGTNLEVLETQKIAADKYLQIIRAGERYMVIAVGKGEVHMLTELSKDEIIFKADSEKNVDFGTIFDRVKNLKQRNEK